MDYPKYETLSHIDPSFPIIFHPDTLGNGSSFYTHWHGAIEILCFLSGCATISINAKKVTAQENDIVIIDANSIHHINAFPCGASYYCLIIDDDFCSELGFPVSDTSFNPLIQNQNLFNIYNLIAAEIQKADAYSKAAAKGYISIFLAEIFRKNISLVNSSVADGQPDKIEAVKTAIRYIHKNYAKLLTVDAVAEHCHISKYYFCRIFKELTGTTTVNYINAFRCMRAKELLTNANYSVSAAARSCGFDNLSYFAKTYKKYMGSLPSSAKQVI